MSSLTMLNAVLRHSSSASRALSPSFWNPHPGTHPGKCFTVNTPIYRHRRERVQRRTLDLLKGKKSTIIDPGEPQSLVAVVDRSASTISSSCCDISFRPYVISSTVAATYLTTTFSPRFPHPVHERRRKRTGRNGWGNRPGNRGAPR